VQDSLISSVENKGSQSQVLQQHRILQVELESGIIFSKTGWYATIQLLSIPQEHSFSDDIGMKKTKDISLSV
jgi:hypothetical protein